MIQEYSSRIRSIIRNKNSLMHSQRYLAMQTHKKNRIAHTYTHIHNLSFHSCPIMHTYAYEKVYICTHIPVYM